ncbi:tyrocidine synthase, putative [Babesia ovis]|uniref:Tyrocidine synthase, putative n=1 Tax=Babesia ovis TaxID=5869 RepID=A0A9W5TAM0_BABOV|nr:tyrocidine synthase, putative [Babesia ovis]
MARFAFAILSLLLALFCKQISAVSPTTSDAFLREGVTYEQLVTSFTGIHFAFTAYITDSNEFDHPIIAQIRDVSNERLPRLLAAVPANSSTSENVGVDVVIQLIDTAKKMIAILDGYIDHIIAMLEQFGPGDKVGELLKKRVVRGKVLIGIVMEGYATNLRVVAFDIYKESVLFTWHHHHHMLAITTAAQLSMTFNMVPIDDDALNEVTERFNELVLYIHKKIDVETEQQNLFIPNQATREIMEIMKSGFINIGASFMSANGAKIRLRK